MIEERLPMTKGSLLALKMNLWHYRNGVWIFEIGLMSAEKIGTIAELSGIQVYFRIQAAKFRKYVVSL